jgi:hypothetical protein
MNNIDNLDETINILKGKKLSESARAEFIFELNREVSDYHNSFAGICLLNILKEEVNEIEVVIDLAAKYVSTNPSYVLPVVILISRIMGIGNTKELNDRLYDVRMNSRTYNERIDFDYGFGFGFGYDLLDQ